MYPVIYLKIPKIINQNALKYINFDNTESDIQSLGGVKGGNGIKKDTVNKQYPF